MKTAYLMKNNKKIRQRLEERGYFVCECCKFDDTKWLFGMATTDDIRIHGIGYANGELTQEQELDRFLAENARVEEPALCCGEDVELFINTLENE